MRITGAKEQTSAVQTSAVQTSAVTHGTVRLLLTTLWTRIAQMNEHALKMHDIEEEKLCLPIRPYIGYGLPQ